MRRMTDSEKIEKLTAAQGVFSLETVRAVLLCPYGDVTHVSEQRCLTCSKLDGSECVDDLIRIYDRERWPNGQRVTSDERDSALNYAVDVLRNWRAKR